MKDKIILVESETSATELEIELTNDKKSLKLTKYQIDKTKPKVYREGMVYLFSKNLVKSVTLSSKMLDKLLGE